MSNALYILVINPGSTSTKVAIFKETELILSKSITHPDYCLKAFDSIADQLNYRLDTLYDVLEKAQFDRKLLSVLVGRGGFLHPLESGTYHINTHMLNDLKIAKYGEHASNLGAMMAYHIALQQSIPAYIVDPIVVDELMDAARYSGIPHIERKSHFHALNVKAVTRKVAGMLHQPYDQMNFVIAHLGGGISVVAHQKGRAIDVNNANNEGPFSSTRAGGLPACELVKLCYSGKYTEKEMINLLTKEGGLYAYTGTKDAIEIERRALAGDALSINLLDAMIHQIGKEIGAMTTVLDGDVDGIILTGGLSHSTYLVDRLKQKLSYLAPIYVVPGEEEMLALAEGAYRVYTGEEKAKDYVAKDLHVMY